MIHSEAIPSPDEIRRIMRAMQITMRNTALHHISHIGLRTLRVLQDLDLFDGQAPPFGEGIDISMLTDPDHPRRQKLSAGPLLLYITEGKEPEGLVVELPMLFLSDSLEIRRAALKILEEMTQRETLRVTPKTSGILATIRTPVLSGKESEWRPAAVALFDGLNDDVLIALQGVRQCIESNTVLQEHLNSYVPRVLKPSISSVESLRMVIRNPESEHDELAKTIEEIGTEAITLVGACQAYYEKLGFLPLAPQFGLSQVVQKWISRHPNVDAWTQLWDWANAASGPVPQYHVCCVFVLHPELVPEGKLPVLWSEILNVIDESDRKEAEEDKDEAFALRCDLVRHYMCHLEAHLPDTDSANISCFAWWLSEQVTKILPDELEAVHFYRENWISRASNVSSHIWLAASSHTQGSFLRYMTFAVHSPWAVSLLSAMGAKLGELAPEEQSNEVRERFQKALVHHLLSSMPFSVEKPRDSTYMLELPLSELVLKWAKHLPEEERESLEQLVAACETLQTAEGLCKALRQIGDSPLVNQVVVAHALKMSALRDPMACEGVWDIVSDTQWRLDALGSVEDHVLGLLVEAFITLLVANRGKWFSWLPHYIAELCERTDDEERRRHLFLYVLHTSLASGTVSAVRRLLRGENKDRFVSLVNEYREQVEAMRSECPPWVAGKLRGLMSNLRVV
jgi:hypothetical protein